MRCSDNVTGVDSAQRNTVDLEGTSDKENALGEVLQEDDALATETASEEDEDSTGDESWARSRRSDGLADLQSTVSHKSSCVDLKELVQDSYCDLAIQHKFESPAIGINHSQPLEKVIEPTFFAWASSSAGYHFFAFWLW